MSEPGTEPVLRMSPSRPRLVVGVGILALLGIFVFEIALSGTFGLGPRLALLGLSSCAFLLAWRLWSAGQVTLEYSRGVLREAGDEGRTLARLDEIRAVDRGVFAFKPSNGFLLRLTKSAPGAWVPGVWWRRGRLIGVGGLIPANQTRAVAEWMDLALNDARRAGDRRET
jgi:hypothetical protein